MGYLKDMHGYRGEEFLKGVLVGIEFYADRVNGGHHDCAADDILTEAIQEATKDLSEKGKE